MHGKPIPKPGLLGSVDAMARASLPTALSALLMLLATAVVGMPGGAAAAALPCIFFWSVFRPAALPPPAVFGLGLLLDLLTAAPLGANVLILLIVHGFATRWRPGLAKQSFLLVWLAFCGFALVAAGLAWGLQALLGWRLPPVPPGLWHVLLTVGLYPMLAWLMTGLQQSLIRAEAAA